MTGRTWVGGGNDNANNPNDWYPTGGPQPGDALVMPDGGTINIRGNDLTGDALQIGNSSVLEQTTLNISHNAHVAVTQVYESEADTTINVAGKDTLNFNSVFPSSPVVTVSLQPHAQLTAAFNLTFGVLDVSGGSGTQVVNDQDDVFNGTHVVITPDVVGSGSISVGSAQTAEGFLEFVHSVSNGQTVTLSGDPERDVIGTLQLDQPRGFHGSVILQAAAQIDLVGLANADSYTIANDMLSVFAHNRVIDRLKLTNDSTFSGQSQDLIISKNGSNVWVTEQGLNNPPSGSIQLPLHT